MTEGDVSLPLGEDVLYTQFCMGEIRDVFCPICLTGCTFKTYAKNNNTRQLKAVLFSSVKTVPGLVPGSLSSTLCLWSSLNSYYIICVLHYLCFTYITYVLNKKPVLFIHGVWRNFLKPALYVWLTNNRQDFCAVVYLQSSKLNCCRQFAFVLV